MVSLGLPSSQQFAAGQDRDHIGATESLLGVMGGQQHGQCALAGETAHRIENPQLVAEIEARGWFVEDQDLRLLSQGAGDGRAQRTSAAHLSFWLDYVCDNVRYLTVNCWSVLFKMFGFG